MGTMLAEPMYTIASTSSALGLSRKTVWGMVADGKIASHRFGRAIRIPQSEVQRLLEESFRPARRAAS